MPANLTPQYYEAKEKLEQATSAQDKIAALEEMLAVIPKHKGTDKLQANLRKRLSQVKKEGDKKKGGSRQDDPFVVEKQGAGQVVLVGLPNSGKSSLVKSLTNAKVKVASYPYTTPLPQPGMMPYQDILIQLLDIPPLTSEEPSGPLVGTLYRADFLLLVIDLHANNCVDQLQILLEHLGERGLLQEKEALVAGNKCDLPGTDEHIEIIEELISEAPDLLPVSATEGENLNQLKERIFQGLNIIRIYSKAPGKEPDYETPFTMKEGSTVMDFAASVHKDFKDQMKSARVWGSSRFDGQAVAQDYLLADGDVVELKL